MDRDVESWLEGTQVVAGTAAEVTDQLAAYKDAGCVHFTGYFPDVVWGDSLDRFAAEVMPALR